MAMPGDALITPNAVISTRAMTIHAPAATVWAWLVQTGQNRGGDWHSYAWLENLFAANMVEGDTLEPRLQELRVSERLFMHAAATANPTLAVEVMGLEPGRALWLRGGVRGPLYPADGGHRQCDCAAPPRAAHPRERDAQPGTGRTPRRQSVRDHQPGLPGTVHR